MNYETLPFPPERKLVVDSGYLGTGRHIFYGLVEVDVTDIRREMDRRKAAGEDLSFTACIAAALGRAIAEHPAVQAYRDWRGRLVLFREVDVVVMVEPSPGKTAVPHIIRNAQDRSVA
jgi:pyruvate/2-oxoglutarate dehydrogenase complex dihydrolipoamide acyltransferase (E2) component